MTTVTTRRMAGILSASEIAALCGVQTTAVSNWKSRYSDFPQSVTMHDGVMMYKRSEVVDWLRAHATRQVDAATRARVTAKEAYDRTETALIEAKAYATRIRKIRK